MKIDIHSFCSDLEQENREPSARNVMTRTMAKVEADRPARRGTRRLVSVLAAAAALAALSLGAYAITKAINVKQVENPVYTYGDEAVEYPGVENVVQFGEVESGNVVAFRTGWMPDGVTNVYSDNLSNYLEDCQMLGVETPDTAMSPDVLDQSLTHLECDYAEGDNPECPLTIDVYSAGNIKDRDFLVDGKASLLEEGEINGMEALYIESEVEGAVGRSLVLYDAGRGCAIGLSSRGSFETLEKVAQGLELVDTDIVSQDLNPGWDWNCLTFGGAKG